MRVSKASMQFLAIGIATIVIATGCSGGGGSSTPPPVERKGSPADLNQCVYRPDEGSIALMSNLGKTEIVDSGFFGKKMNGPDLEAVLESSAINTIAYARGLGLNLYRTPFKRENAVICPTFDTLEYAPERLQKIWDSANGETTGDVSLMGLYFDYPCLPEAEVPAGGRTCKETKIQEPVILVTEATDKWTLVHEMMHSNFKKVVRESGAVMIDSELERQTIRSGNAFAEAMKAFEESPNRQDLEAAIEHLKSLTDLSIAAMGRGKLEETAIEGLLIEKWVNGEIKYVSTTASSLWYMSVSADEALSKFPDKELLQQVEKLLTAADERFWPEYKPSLIEIKEKLVGFRKSVADSIEIAKARLNSKGIDTKEEPKQNKNKKPSTKVSSASKSEFTFVDLMVAKPEINESGMDPEALLKHLESHENKALTKALESVQSKLRTL